MPSVLCTGCDDQYSGLFLYINHEKIVHNLRTKLVLNDLCVCVMFYVLVYSISFL